MNPTNPRDRTVDWEADIVNAFRADGKLTELIGERDGPLGRSLHLARPIKITDAGCLTCHTTPEVAPASVVKAYGTNNGYGWKLNETVGAQIVSVPMAVPIEMAKKAFQALLATLVGVFVFILVFLNILLWFVVIRPIRNLSSMADRVSTGDLGAPDVAVRGSDEVAVLAGSFNRMRISLGKALKMLEDE
jgi:protein-histidine pros-kinase